MIVRIDVDAVRERAVQRLDRKRFLNLRVRRDENVRDDDEGDDAVDGVEHRRAARRHGGDGRRMTRAVECG